ncbi:glycosyl hydrolase family 25 [Butyrivibrio sp. CB08]|uniref:GH25 family lysozyme n=1 Tax=Butyrivibrio sp. CB08 TaxID=2364879 RepID=UPI000EA9DC77|nr:GH25 family lysozyme [Butyrivibrio sp. CB08]RKM59176.1 glycosyl hydrolase family 25 [Butyrivibrio sp. CB08]
MKYSKLEKKIKRRITVIVFIALLTIIIATLLFTQKIATSIGFKYAIQGVDVSHFQGDIDWNVLEKQGISFAYIKATEGSSSVDSCLNQNYQGIQNTGLEYGFYHFLSLESTPEAQLENFKAATGEYHMDLIPAIDIEWYGDERHNPPEKEEVLNSLFQMVSLFEKEYGQKPVVYTTQSYYLKYFYGEKLDFPIWIRNVYFSPFQEWAIWQYTDRAVIDGYCGDEIYIDRDVMKDSEYKNIRLND